MQEKGQIMRILVDRFVSLLYKSKEDVVAYKIVELGRGIITEIRPNIKDVKAKAQSGKVCFKILTSLWLIIIFIL